MMCMMVKYANHVLHCEAVQFAVAVTNHRPLS